jgi:hypothetical protein
VSAADNVKAFIAGGFGGVSAVLVGELPNLFNLFF